MGVTIIPQTVISRPIVSMDGAARLNYSLNERQQAVTGCIFNVAQAYPANSMITFIFDGNANQCLSAAPRPRLPDFFPPT